MVPRFILGRHAPRALRRGQLCLDCPCWTYQASHSIEGLISIRQKMASTAKNAGKPKAKQSDKPAIARRQRCAVRGSHASATRSRPPLAKLKGWRRISNRCDRCAHTFSCANCNRSNRHLLALTWNWRRAAAFSNNAIRQENEGVTGKKRSVVPFHDELRIPECAKNALLALARMATVTHR